QGLRRSIAKMLNERAVRFELGLEQLVEISQLQTHRCVDGGPAVTACLCCHSGKTGAQWNGLLIHQTYGGPLPGLDLALHRQQGTPHVQREHPSTQAPEGLLMRRWRLRVQTLKRLQGCGCTYLSPLGHGLCQTRLTRLARRGIEMNQGDSALIRHTGL